MVEQSQAKQYVLPEGWDSREKVARELNCAEDSVKKHMSLLLKSGKAETKTFPVWDNVMKRVRPVVAYRKTGK